MTPPPRHPRAFTLAELLVSISIIAILATLTVIAVGAIADDARLSSGRNTVAAVLDTARALAIKNNDTVMVVFRPDLDGDEQFVEAVTAKWTGEAFPAHVMGLTASVVVDRFVPIADAPVRRLPTGIKVAGPTYAVNDNVTPWRNDLTWTTQCELPKIDQATGNGEAPGQQIAIMFSADGSTITRNLQTDSDFAFVDYEPFDEVAGKHQTIWDGSGWQNLYYSAPGGLTLNRELFEQVYPFQRLKDDEPFVQIVPFLAVFDDAEARELFGDDDWNDPETRDEQISRYVSDRADRIHFNRYTGVVMR